MRFKHKIRINVADSANGETRLMEGAVRRLPLRFLKWLFGEYTNVYLMTPGQSIESVEIHDCSTDPNSIQEIRTIEVIGKED